MKILILALSGIGDALMFTPALTLIRLNFPDAEISAVVMFKGVKDIYERTGLLDNLIHFDFLKAGYKSSLGFLASLKNRKYDYSFNVYPSNRLEYNIVNYFIGAKKRVAVEYLRQNIINLGFLNNITIKENDQRHNVEENVLLASKALDFSFDEIPSLSFPLLFEDEIYADEVLRRLKIAHDELLICFHPGCSLLKNHIMRRWEPDKFADLAKMLIVRLKAKIILLGGPEERRLRNEIMDDAQDDNIYAPETQNLGQTAALIKKSKVFVTNDSSLMHVASAMKSKTVAIIGPTNINYIRPWQTEHIIASEYLKCSPCFFYSPKPLSCSRPDNKFKCIKELMPEKVYQAVRTILGV